MPEPIRQFTAAALPVEVYASEAEMGRAAARSAARVLREAVAARGSARAVMATGNSQFAFTDALRAEDVPWDHVTVFHMDEYVGIDREHPASFRRWIGERIERRLGPALVEYIHGDAPDAKAECDRYEELLRSAPIDLVCMGIGENGHLAFNEPFEADFDDDRWVRVITLLPESLTQQVGEGHFPDIDAVPPTAISLTIPALLAAAHVQVCAPEQRKAAAVAAALREEISTACPATILRRTPHATLYLEPASAGALGADTPVAGSS
ncbi:MULTISPECIES: 6-phosphogluconolactonase [Actinoalloteichus]|uniref:6-phosphogluconolactonase/glucosamine-6-phosphate isomerase/deaminase n=1 Tax=Actinoalloteichus fjordicus TaxID=1612552 RepID=A0AAC9LGI5_9PSEU|nr:MULTISPECIES: 6-phosphogluconolactonase [Actinoalloteichus]APU16455.1 6-phosphogluconolactonase/glucosamine-6-phosphate isomerase/deaminase [Actinoalloteichus fjordicus]APU22514.1 6-phosphogluconolactonase/glucosamine-6-phosphate isomerase/deaminase [Actinoalloteichus sp. GBA129-24]